MLNDKEKAEVVSANLGDDEYIKIAADRTAEAAAEGPVAVDPDVADYMGAFEEEALSEEDALDSFLDGEEPEDDGDLDDDEEE